MKVLAELVAIARTQSMLPGNYGQDAFLGCPVLRFQPQLIQDAGKPAGNVGAQDFQP